MIRTRLFFPVVLLAAASAPLAAADGGVGIGVDYSRGSYGSDTQTEILSIPLRAQLVAGNWTLRASLPWLRVDGDPDVLPSVGLVDNLNPVGRGRGLLDGTPDNGAERGRASGIGDLALSATYSLPLAGAFGVDLSASAKIATADEDKGLGTGANDYGVAVDLSRDFDGITLFGGVGHTWLGDSRYIATDSVRSGNLGVSQRAGRSRVGLMYDYRDAAAGGFDDRRDIVGFMTVPSGAAGRIQLHLAKGLSDGGPDWGAGASFTRTF
jgi:hypothetical protein